MKPKKSLGQNFLKDQDVLKKIISSIDLSADDLVVEIGPGEGALTSELDKKVGKLILVEKDHELANKVARNFQFPIINFQKITNNQFYRFPNQQGIISGDILQINLPELLEDNDFNNYKLIANIPYYITAPIIKLFLETKYPPTVMILMIQKEVAERIVALPREIPTSSRDAKRISRGRPGQMSILAVSVQYYATAEILFYVDKTAFWPVPEVDSAVIKITPLLSLLPPASSKLQRGEQASKDDRKKFFRVVRAGFSSKRKLLLNNLSASFHLEKKEAEEKIKKAGIDPGSRAQELSVEDWKKLADVFSSLSSEKE